MNENQESAAPKPTEAVKHLKMQPLRRMVESAQSQSKKDSLTGLPNRRALFERLGEEIVRAKRFGHDLSLIFLDIDGFKKVNSVGRHFLGDKVMVELAGQMTHGVRDNVDILCRYGGDEFVVILPETNRQKAGIVALRVLQKLDYSVVLGPTKINLGGSLGVVSLSEEDQDASSFIDRADEVMDTAKHESRKLRGQGKNILGCIAAGDKITTYNRQGKETKVEYALAR